MPRIPSLHQEMSSLRVLTGPEQFNFSSVSTLTIEFASRLNLTIRMGGGPRTFPGGVSKWQWKRMQAKKSKQLLKARLLRERQIYEMRKRAELKAAISELERPWEAVEKAPTLFSVQADEQVKVLADRFQKPGGFDMWSEEDGPRIFQTPAGLPSARFFPKDVVHSVKPYGVVDTSDSARPATSLAKEAANLDDWTPRSNGGKGRSKRLAPNSKGDMVERQRSTSLVGGGQGKITNKSMDVYRKSRRDIYDNKGRTFSEDSSYRSSSFDQITSRPVTRQGPKRNLSDHSTRKPHSANRKPPSLPQTRTKLDLGIPFTSDSDSSTEFF